MSATDRTIIETLRRGCDVKSIREFVDTYPGDHEALVEALVEEITGLENRVAIQSGDLARLRRLDDGVSRPVSALEREVCGRAAAQIELALTVLKQIEAEMNAGLGSSYGETRVQVRRAIAALTGGMGWTAT